LLDNLYFLIFQHFQHWVYLKWFVFYDRNWLIYSVMSFHAVSIVEYKSLFSFDCSLCFTMLHRFSIELTLGDWDSHGNRVIFSLAKNFLYILYILFIFPCSMFWIIVLLENEIISIQFVILHVEKKCPYITFPPSCLTVPNATKLNELIFSDESRFNCLLSEYGISITNNWTSIYRKIFCSNYYLKIMSVMSLTTSCVEWRKTNIVYTLHLKIITFPSHNSYIYINIQSLI